MTVSFGQSTAALPAGMWEWVDGATGKTLETAEIIYHLDGNEGS